MLEVSVSEIILCAFGAAIAIAVLYAFLEPFRFVIREIELEFPGLPQEFDGLKILHLSDTHIRQMGRLERTWAKTIAKRPADLCVWTGDLVRFVKSVPLVFELLPSIKTARPVYAVLGNSEHKPHVDTSAMIEAFQSQPQANDFKLLVNASAAIERDGAKISIVGVDDPYSGFDDFDAAFQGVDRDGFVIVLAHCPSASERALTAGADLVLSGHTHGGQLRVPGFGVLWTHMKAPTPLNDGLYFAAKECPDIPAKPGAAVFVHRGLGTSKIPIRFLCRPEIVYITLRQENHDRQLPAETQNFRLP